PRHADFGAFMELEPGIEGLVHISELAPQRVRRVSDIVQVDQEVRVLILQIDAANRKIGLSLKGAQAKETPEEPAAQTEEAPAEPVKPRTTPLRGGVGQDWTLPDPSDKE